MTVDGCTLDQIIDRAQEKVGRALAPVSSRDTLADYLRRRRAVLQQGLASLWPDTKNDTVVVPLVAGTWVYTLPELLGIRRIEAVPVAGGNAERVAPVHPEDIDAEVGLRVTLRATQLVLVHYPQDWYNPNGTLKYAQLNVLGTVAAAAPALGDELADDPRTARLYCQWLELDAAIWLARKFQMTAAIPKLIAARSAIERGLTRAYTEGGKRMHDRYRRAHGDA